MQQHQFDSFESALAYLNERGTPTYWGWIGQLEGYYLYTLPFGFRPDGLCNSVVTMQG